MMVAGERAELHGLNMEGLRRCGFSVAEVSFEWNYFSGAEFNGFKKVITERSDISVCYLCILRTDLTSFKGSLTFSISPNSLLIFYVQCLASTHFSSRLDGNFSNHVCWVLVTTVDDSFMLALLCLWSSKSFSRVKDLFAPKAA